MDTHADPNNTPTVGSETPVTQASVPKQPLKKNAPLFFILLIFIIVAVTIAVVLFRNSQSQKTDNTTAPSSQTPPVNLRAEYQNPFDKSAQYENPFENLE